MNFSLISAALLQSGDAQSPIHTSSQGPLRSSQASTTTKNPETRRQLREMSPRDDDIYKNCVETTRVKGPANSGLKPHQNWIYSCEDPYTILTYNFYERDSYCCPWHTLCEPEGTKQGCKKPSKCNADAQCAKGEICHRSNGHFNGKCEDVYDLEPPAPYPTCKDNQVPAEGKWCLKKHKNYLGSKYDDDLDVEKTCAQIIQDDSSWCLKGYYPSYKNELRAMMDCCAKSCNFCY